MSGYIILAAQIIAVALIAIKAIKMLNKSVAHHTAVIRRLEAENEAIRLELTRKR